LEDLLHAAEQRATEQLRKADQLAQELAHTRQDQEAIVSSAAASATAQDVQITRLRQELDSSKQQMVVLQASLDALQTQHQEVMTSKDSIEGGALEGASLWEVVASAGCDVGAGRTGMHTM
jgi:chromosome segregation ATPase